jgi:putative ABC transport system permease protein
MFKNYIRTTWRDLWKQKSLTVINVLGLSLGLVCFMLCLLYAVNELSYDRFHKNSDQIYRVYRWKEAMRGEPAEGDPYLPIPLGPALKADFPDVESMVRMRGAWDANYVRVKGITTQLAISFADSNFFNLFSFKIKYGNQQSPIHELNNIVLTEKSALRLFGESNPVGRTLEVKNGEAFENFLVSAVAYDRPSNTSIPFDALCNFNKLRSFPRMERRWFNWGHSSYFTFVKLREGSALAADRARMDQFRKKYYPNDEQELRSAGYWKDAGTPITYKMQAISDLHTQSNVWGGIVPTINKRNIWILLGIAIAVLLMACINFTTLSIGRSASRSREIGVRKVLGSNRSSLVVQFLTESLFLAVFSAGIGLIGTRTLLPIFNKIADRQLKFSFSQFPELIWMLTALVLVTGIIAGLYPSLVLSGFRPVEVLKNKIRLGGSNGFTKSLVTVQFVVSIALIISTIIILKQIDYMISKNPGFDKDNVVIVDADGTESSRIFPLFKEKVLTIPGVQGVASSELGLGADQGWSRQGWDYNGKHFEAYEYFVDNNYLDVLKLKLVSGRNFQQEVTQDTVTSVIINESMMRLFNWTPETALGQKLNNYFGAESPIHPVVIGVVHDFNFRSLSEATGPQLFHQFSSYVPFKYFIRMNPGEPGNTLSAIAHAWSDVEPVYPFRYSFLDENLSAFYSSEKRLSKIIAWAGGISIFLACMGLFGLASLSVINRRKEIGIRKIIGASVFDITSIISKEFIFLVLIGIAIASPIAYFLMNKWLADFAYRISIHWLIFVITGLMGVSISVLTISIQCIKASMANPVKSLRIE